VIVTLTALFKHAPGVQHLFVGYPEGDSNPWSFDHRSPLSLWEQVKRRRTTSLALQFSPGSPQHTASFRHLSEPNSLSCSRWLHLGGDRKHF